MRSIATRRGTRPGVLLLAVAASSVVPVGMVSGQGTVDIREVLEDRERLTRDLHAALERIETLEAELADLRNERRGLEARVREAELVLSSLRRELAGPGERRVEPRPTAPVPEDPLSSPASLLRELRAQYYERMRSVPDGTGAERAAYREEVALWCRLTERSLRGKRTWLVELDDLVPLARDRAVARLTVIDEQTGLPIGDPVDVAVPAKFADRVQREPRYDRWLLTAIVIATPGYNESRLTRGVFEYPPFVGPYVDFDFELDWISLRGWRPGQTEPAGDAQAEENPDAPDEVEERGAPEEEEEEPTAAPEP